MAQGFVIERPPSQPIPVGDPFRAGAGTRDITPALGTTLSGYGSIRSEAATRMCGRLFATALVLDDGQGGRVALVSVDLHAGTRYLAELAAARLSRSCGVGIDRLYLAATHTHSGPGHVYGNTLYDGMTARGRGFDEEGAARIAEGIALAVEDAVSALRPARLGVGAALCWGYSMNRSLEAFGYDGASPAAHARRFGAIRPRGLTEENLAVDPRVQVLWAEAIEGSGMGGDAIGVFATFGAHATAIAARQATLSADVFGRAVRDAQDRLVRAGTARSRVPIALAAGAIGDVDLDVQGQGAHALVEQQGVELAERIGRVLGEALVSACGDARERLTSAVRLRALLAEPNPAGAFLADGRRLAEDAAYGVPALAGSEMGRNFMLDPGRLSTALSLEGSRGLYDPNDPQAPKLMAMRGLVTRITGRAAPVLPLRLVEITLGQAGDTGAMGGASGDRRISIAGIPGEPTTRFAAAIERVLADGGADHVMVSGLTGDYAGYFTTEKEYEKQHYEGACTIWGRSTLGFVGETLRGLRRSGTAELAGVASFEKDEKWQSDWGGKAPPPGEPWPAEPSLEFVDGVLSGRWTALAGCVPRFGPEPWIALEVEDPSREGVWQRLSWLGAEVNDQSRELLVERTPRGSHASWTFQWTLPPELRRGSLRFVLLPPEFGGPLASNAVGVQAADEPRSASASLRAERSDARSDVRIAADYRVDFEHPATEAELVSLVRAARERRCALRVRGSGHSIARAIYSDERLAGQAGSIDVMLDRYRGMRFDDARRRVTVEAGCHLGVDPRDPTGTSTWEGSLLAALEARGWALPDLGGVTHQTVSGFLMTGSSGGSVTYAIEEAVAAIRFIDGLGVVREVERGRDDLFDAVVCSMGLLGVISTITFECVPRFDVIGREDITTEAGCGFGLYDSGPGGLGEFLRRTEYSRLMWWPQKGVERVVTWQARRMVKGDYSLETGPRGALRPKAYQAFGEDMPQGRLSRPAATAVQWAGGKFYDALEVAGQARRALDERLPILAPIGRVTSAAFSQRLLPRILGQFVPLDAHGAGGPQRFWDAWHDGLPMDNQMSDASLPTTFTEIFVPLDEAGRAMRLLRDHFAAGGIDATGSFIFEIYAARATHGWLHPAYERDSLRIDVFWFERNRQDPTRFFEQFWDLMAPLGYRLHWGKHLPGDGGRGARYLRRQYPRWDDFLRLRAELDPLGIFLNEHFRLALGIGQESASASIRTAQSTQPDANAAESLDMAQSARAAGSLAGRLQSLYEQMAADREPALDRLSDVFSDDIAFRDPFRTVAGIPAFRELFVRMFKQYRAVNFTGFRLHGDDEEFTLTYDMHMRMSVGPEFVMSMCSVVRARNGKVVEMTDYYDFPSGLVSPMAAAARAYRWVANRFM